MTRTLDYEQALKAAQGLAERSDEALFEELGLRIRDKENLGGEERSQQYEAPYSQKADDMLSLGDLRKVGERWWQNLEPELMKLVCDPKNEDTGKITSGKTIPQVAASLATAAVVSTLGPPAWVIVATTILATKIAESGVSALCQTWRESLEAERSGTA
jgi:hypothetical protein